jgi:hypothetical protein
MLQQERFAEERVYNEETGRACDSAHQCWACTVLMRQAWLASRAPAVSYGYYPDPARSQIAIVREKC